MQMMEQEGIHKNEGKIWFETDVKPPCIAQSQLNVWATKQKKKFCLGEYWAC